MPYPFGEYHQAFVPDFNAGAMENPGCVTLRDTFLYRGRATATDRSKRADVVAHELAHMWFGDLVTMRWWDDLWLNESFAEYLEQRCCAEVTRYPQWTEFGVVRKDWGFVADQSPTSHPVAGRGADDAETALQQFDGISYAKGAAVLKQLASYLGEEVFLRGLRSYVRRHAFGPMRRSTTSSRPGRMPGRRTWCRGRRPGCGPRAWTPSTRRPHRPSWCEGCAGWA